VIGVDIVLIIREKGEEASQRKACWDGRFVESIENPSSPKAGASMALRGR